jgi:hypothetical protein
MENAKGNWRMVCVAKCFKGSSWKGTLWIVWDYEKIDPDKPADFPFEGKRWIECDLLQYSKRDDGWGYKDMEESMHPYVYNCPEKYLKMVPVAHEGWREGVKAHHEKRREKLRQRRAKKVEFCA